MAAETVRGTVVHEGGAPVAGAVVGIAAAEAAAVALTDTRGAFQLRLPACCDPGRVTLVAADTNLVACRTGSTAAELALVLRPAMASGVLRDWRGEPVPAAMVQVVSLHLPPKPGQTVGDLVPWPAAPFPRCSAVTDAWGRFQLTHLLPGGGCVLKITHDGYLEQHLDVPVVRDGTLKPRRQVRAGSVAGRVARADGTPVAGVRVEARNGYGNALGSATTGVDGRYAVGGLPPPHCDVALADPSAPVTAHARHQVRVRAGWATEGVDLVAIDGSVLPVRVVDADTGEGMADVRLSGSGPAGFLPTAPPVVTDARGWAYLRTPPGDLAVHIAVPHGAWLDLSANPGGAVLAPGMSPAPFVLRMQRGRAVAVVVTDDRGTPLAHCLVDCELTDTRCGVQDWHQMATDSAGRFHLAATPRDGRVRLAVREANGLHRGSVESAVDGLPAGAWTTVVPRLEKQAVQGRVIADSGRALAGATVMLTHKPPQPYQGPLVRPQYALTNAAGVYHFSGLPRAEGYEVSARLKAHRSRAPVAVQAGAEPQAADLVLDALDGEVRGRVLDAAGRPAARATVMAVGWRGCEAESTADGSFALRGLPPGEVRLLALHGRAAVAEATVPAGATNVELRSHRPTAPGLDRERRMAADVCWQVWRLGAPEHLNFGGEIVWLARVDPAGLARALREVGAEATALAFGLEALAHAAPALCAEQVKLLDGDGQECWQALVGAALAPTLPAVAGKLFERARRPAAEPHLDLARAALAGRLGLPEAVVYADGALKGEDAEQQRSQALFACQAWAASPMLLDTALAALGAEDRFAGELLSAMGLLSRNARGALARFDEIWTPAAQRYWTAGGTDDRLLSRAIQGLALALAPSDPAAAERVCSLAPPTTRGLAFAMAAAVAADRAAAVRLIRRAEAAVEQLDRPAEAFVATTALARDAPTGERLSAAFLADLDEQCWDAASLAVIAAREPNVARKLLERRVGVAAEAPAPLPSDEETVLAACCVDLGRALELAMGATPPHHRAAALRVIARWLVCPPSLRTTDLDLLADLVPSQVSSVDPLLLPSS